MSGTVTVPYGWTKHLKRMILVSTKREDILPLIQNKGGKFSSVVQLESTDGFYFRNMVNTQPPPPESHFGIELSNPGQEGAKTMQIASSNLKTFFFDGEGKLLHTGDA